MQYLKFCVISILFLLALSPAAAQDDKKVTLSLTASPNVGWFHQSNKGYESDGSKLGIQYGLLMDFRLFGEANYAFTTGFTLNHLGGKTISPTTFTDATGAIFAAKENATYHLTYIDVPLMFTLKTHEIGYSWYYGVFGSELGFNLNAKKDFTTTYGGFSTPEVTSDVGEEVHLLRSSLVVGLGMERMISGNTHFRVGLTYHNGLTNIFKGKSVLVDQNGNTVINSDGSTNEDRDLTTKFKFIELNLAIVF